MKLRSGIISYPSDWVFSLPYTAQNEQDKIAIHLIILLKMKQLLISVTKCMLLLANSNNKYIAFKRKHVQTSLH